MDRKLPTMSSPKKLGGIVARNSILRQLVQQAAQYAEIELRFLRLIDEPLRGHIHAALWRDGKLTLVVESAAWAAKLRYKVPELHSLCKSDPDCPEVDSIRVKIDAREGSGPEQKPRRMPALSASDAASLESCAGQVSDPALKGILRRLKRHHL
ncbi:MAG: hypothetical protein ACI915_003110 [Gammaproteobacteria bacterium]|jgi:hypothetical protein